MAQAAHGARRHLSVVLPCFNEAERLPESLPRIVDYLKQHGIDAEILVVDDGSSDGTRQAAERCLKGVSGRVLRSGENRGKGHAVRTGVLAAEGRWVLVTDADLSTPIEEHARLQEAARDYDLDVAFGSRALPESRVEVRQNAIRESLGKSFNVVARAFTGLKFRDTQCGFKLMDRSRVLPLFQRMVVDGFAWDVELLFLCERMGLRVRELPVAWRNNPASRVSLVTAPPPMILDLLRIRWRFRRGLYHRDATEDAV